MTDTTATEAAAGDKADELKTEADELTADIKEAKAEATQARQDGDDERAARLEASIAATQKELADIKASLKALIERPFAPAPGDTDTTASDGQGDDGQGDDGQGDGDPKTDDTPGPPKKKHWLYGDRWNQD